MTDRRQSIAAVALTLAFAWPVRAQTPARIAWIVPSDAAVFAPYMAAFQAGLHDNGLQIGKDVVIDVFYADGHYERFPALIDAALRREPALMMVVTIASVRAAQLATRSIPIVFVSTNDPLGSGLVASLARPGGNTTGVSNQAEDVIGKYVELLRDVLPQTRRIAVLSNPGNPSNARMFEHVRAAAMAQGIGATSYEADSPQAIGPALERIAAQHHDALLMNSDAMLFQHRGRIGTFALKQRLAAITTSPQDAESGFLLAYGADRPDMYRRAATYARKILAGAKPAELPVEQPTRFRLVVNLKAARALGITMPRSLLLRADEVIE